MIWEDFKLGMWEELNEELWDRISSEWITGMEISQFQSKESLESLIHFCRQNEITYGVHTPLLNHRGYTLPRLKK